MESVSLYSEARNEYLKQMSTWIVPSLVDFFRTNYQEISVTEGKKTMTSFQNWCSEIPKWNQDIIEKNIELILDSCKCDYIEDLMTAVFIAHTKMLTAVRISSKQKKLQITLPKLDHFLHRVFVECARIFWKAPYMFLDELSPIEKQKNILQAESMCTEALSSAVRSLLPIKSILRDYLEEDDDTDTVKESFKKEELSDSDSGSESDSSSDSDKKRKTKKHSTLENTQVNNIIAPIEVNDAAFINTETEIKEFEKPKQEPIVEKMETETILEKVDSEPSSIQDGGSTLEHIETLVSEPFAPTPVPAVYEEIKIDTEPSVRFSDYETVFDENVPNGNEIRYAPKMSIEEMPQSSWHTTDVPTLQINNDSGSLIGIDEIEDLDPVTSQAQAQAQVQAQVQAQAQAQEPSYVDAPLSSMGLEFEELS